MIQSLVLSFDVYEDLLGKCHKGVDFYDRLQANASKLLERTERVCRMQYEERQQIITRHQPKGEDNNRLIKLFCVYMSNCQYLLVLFHSLCTGIVQYDWYGVNVVIEAE